MQTCKVLNNLHLHILHFTGLTTCQVSIADSSICDLVPLHWRLDLATRRLCIQSALQRAIPRVGNPRIKPSPPPPPSGSDPSEQAGSATMLYTKRWGCIVISALERWAVLPDRTPLYIMIHHRMAFCVYSIHPTPAAGCLVRCCHVKQPRTSFDFIDSIRSFKVLWQSSTKKFALL